MSRIHRYKGGSTTTSINVPNELLEEIDKYARRSYRSRSQFIAMEMTKAIQAIREKDRAPGQYAEDWEGSISSDIARDQS